MMLVGCNSGQPPSVPLPTERTSPPATNGTASPKPQTENQPERKDRVVLTPRAAAQISKLLKEHGAKYLRVSVSDDHRFKLDLDEQMDPKADYLSESRGIPIVVDRKSSLLLPFGIRVDFAEEKGKPGFKFISPESDMDSPDTSKSLVEARRGFKTKLLRREGGGKPAANPPAELFRTVTYRAAPGQLAAYLTPDPGDDKKHPAIIWITGGDCNTIDQGCWQEGEPSNDQSASAYRKVGIVMMFPSLRGGNDNPGVKEGFFGEVDDVLAAAEFLGQQTFVDRKRIYLGGHSTGGTLALLTAECSDRFRAVFSFGPTNDVIGYGAQYNPFALSDPQELRLRAPGRWLHSIHSPVFVFEGTSGNLSALQAMARSSKNPQVLFFEIKGADHFDVLAPTNRLIAEKILRDTGPTCGISFTGEELNKPFGK
jgi:Fe-S cluster assembly iron-binding protein IscA/pimeloyl-ACP methyl ester carboxylesterase